MTTTGSGGLAPGDYIGRLRAEGASLAATAEGLDLDLPVPCCPGWRLRDLLRHVGYVHRWAAGYVTERHPEPVGRLDEAGVLAQDIPDGELVAWFRAGHAALVRALEQAEPGLVCWTFLPGAASPLAFWARRQAHETTMHRVDAQLSAAAVGVPAGHPGPVPDTFAADGIDELLMGFFRRNAAAGPLSGPPRSLFVDTGPGGRWLVWMGPERAGVDRGWGGAVAGPADCLVAGPAPELYLLLWNRRGPDGLEITGDPGVLEHWRQDMRVTWR